MQKIDRVISTEAKIGATLYRYSVIDELGNKQAVSSIQKYELGEEVQLIWTELSTKYNTAYLKKIKKSQRWDSGSSGEYKSK